MTNLLPAETKRIQELFYKGISREDIAKQVGHSSSTVHRAIKNHEGEVAAKGLLQTLQDGGLSEAYELALLKRDLDKNKMTINDCGQAMPVVVKGRELKADLKSLPDLIDAAVKNGEPTFARQEYADALVRIHRREKQTGQTIEEIETRHRTLNEEAQKVHADILELHTEESQLQTKVNNLKQEEQSLKSKIETAQTQLTSIQGQLQKAKLTEEDLNAYKADEEFFAKIGLEITDRSKARHVFTQLASLGYDAANVIRTIQAIGDLGKQKDELNTHIVTLEKSREALRAEVNGLLQQIGRLETEIVSFEQRSKQAEANAQNAIEQSKRRIQDRLDSEKKTIQDIEESGAFTRQLDEANIKRNDVQILRRIIDEAGKASGKPGELARQLSLNATLEDRRNELTQQIDSLVRRKGQLGEELQTLGNEIASTQAKRDDVVFEVKNLIMRLKNLKKEIEGLRAELASRLRTETEWKTIEQRIQQRRLEIVKLEQEMQENKTEIAAAHWLRSLLTRNKSALFWPEKDYVKKFLEENGHVQPYDDAIAQKIIQLAGEKLTQYGALVPKFQFSHAMYVGRQQIESMKQFLHEPEKMSTLQRKIILQTAIETDALNKEGFESLLKRIVAVLKCPIHNKYLELDRGKLRWVCPTLSCNYTI